MEEITKFREKWLFVGPTLFDNVSKDMTIYKEEIFGPVVSVIRVNNYDEALQLVNDHPLETEQAFIHPMAKYLDTSLPIQKIGMVGVNVPIPVPMAFHSFVDGNNHFLAIIQFMAWKGSL